MLEAKASHAAGTGALSIEERVDQFVERQRQQQEKLELEKRRRNMTIAEMVKQAKPLPAEVVDNIFSPYLLQKIDGDSVELVKKRLHAMRLKINTLDVKKRFLILETTDFFRSRISIGKLIPAILLLQDTDKKKAFFQFVIPTFKSINKNVETLVSTTELFTQETLHLNRGSLYSFISDLAKIILPIFKPEYLKRFSNIVSPVELLTVALKPFNPANLKKDGPHFAQVIDDNARIQKILLDFVVAIQSHEALFNYALKRHGYYKLFLNRLTDNDRFENQSPFLISKILAGCFMANTQIKPNTTLIDAMVDKQRYAAPATVKAKRSFIDRLAPSTIVNIINQFKTHFKLLLKGTGSDEFADVMDLSVKSILKKVWTGFTKLADDGLSMITAPFEILINQIKRTFLSFVEDEKKEEEQAKRNLNKPVTTIIPKRQEHLAHLKKHYMMVKPDIIGFRGASEGANQKDFAYNSRFFRKGEITMLEFTFCFSRLFEHLIKNNTKKVLKIEHDRQRQILEYHTTFRFDEHLISLGLTRLKSENANETQKKDIFPYVLLFSESEGAKNKRIPSRKLTIEGKQKTFDEAQMTQKNTKLLYKSLLYILHLLPDEDWNASACQACIKFIIRELKKIASRS